MNLNEILTGDARELSRAVPDESVNLVLTDPPYNVGFSGYDVYRDEMTERDYVEMIAGLRRLGPVAIIQYPEQMMRYVVPALGTPDHVSAWCYSSNLTRRFRLVNYYGVVPDYERVKQPYKNPDDKRVADRIRRGGNGTPLYEWWHDIQIVKNVSAEKTEHPCPVPIRLMERIITLCTDAGDVVLDPFCGSGTTCVAAKRLSRHYVGFEISENYAELARERVQNTQPPLPGINATQAVLL